MAKIVRREWECVCVGTPYHHLDMEKQRSRRISRRTTAESSQPSRRCGTRGRSIRGEEHAEVGTAISRDRTLERTSSILSLPSLPFLFCPVWRSNGDCLGIFFEPYQCS
jgi:hypothetical protein